MQVCLCHVYSYNFVIQHNRTHHTAYQRSICKISCFTLFQTNLMGSALSQQIRVPNSSLLVGPLSSLVQLISSLNLSTALSPVQVWFKLVGPEVLDPAGVQLQLFKTLEA
eukprot:TRINITY_DN50778_c0_g1_i1.p1 TRINITY_DN50778_c0_g1~~TRINITY_DN50778_c0_g1_i1.p1  ORF type:complete len:110 (+),score=3.49 TRINITY_DN50778_c0_g1_i1:412-741(+)